MRLKIYKIIFWVSLGGIPVLNFGIINAMVSLKYETDATTECISKVNGQNLCQSIQTYKDLNGVCIFIIALLAIFRKRLLTEGN
ncbi:hypothetical protein [Desertivirga brevis]|uniref:hypothetical protein n=1 Tax=Desertivirga brevis TaxID=2810310 RepID=UPI001A963778|nr:hypothetical protein [Pedobacter sp. SYSU D00873]